MRYTDEHAYGYSVMLWRAGECLFGLFESSQGLAGDTPIGELQNVKYDRRTGRLSFSAKLTAGMVTFRGSNGEETSRDLFTFVGTLDARTLTGAITYVLQNDAVFAPTRTDVVLKPSKTAAAFMKGSTTRGEHGIPQHDLYHAGQVLILRKALRAGRKASSERSEIL